MSKRATVYSVKFPKCHLPGACLNVGKCCLKCAMALKNAHYEATVRRSDEIEICEWCDSLITPESDEDFEP